VKGTITAVNTMGFGSLIGEDGDELACQACWPAEPGEEVFYEIDPKTQDATITARTTGKDRYLPITARCSRCGRRPNPKEAGPNGLTSRWMLSETCPDCYGWTEPDYCWTAAYPPDDEGEEPFYYYVFAHEDDARAFAEVLDTQAIYAHLPTVVKQIEAGDFPMFPTVIDHETALRLIAQGPPVVIPTNSWVFSETPNQMMARIKAGA
jgi:hypothetical protein